MTIIEDKERMLKDRVYMWIISLINTNSPHLENVVIHEMIEKCLTDGNSKIESTLKFDDFKFTIDIELKNVSLITDRKD